MNILGISPHHHSSVCLLQDGEIKFFNQEERIVRTKKAISFPFKTLIDVIQNNHIDFVAQCSPGIQFPLSDLNNSNSEEDTTSYFGELINRYHPDALIQDFGTNDHHLIHAFHSFYNSRFKEAIGVVIDGLGSGSPDFTLRETETFYHLTYPHKHKILFKNLSAFIDIDPYQEKESNKTISPCTNISRCYEQVTTYLGWGINEAGKTMGLSSYGKPNTNLPSFFIDQFDMKYGNPKIFIPDYIEDIRYDHRLSDSYYPILSLPSHPKSWHRDSSKITQIEKDISWKIQNDTQQIVGDYIERSIKKTGLKQVCCSGGYFLNCVTNYYLIKRFPDIEFYFEPIANDAGTAIGAAKLLWHQLTEDTTIRPFKSLYLGKHYSKDELLEGIKNYTCEN
tara:strand:- start:1337 stop:2515 length:1179 start_codon:yes stop_codon:yes gene_type:complete